MQLMFVLATIKPTLEALKKGRKSRDTVAQVYYESGGSETWVTTRFYSNYK